MSLARSRQPWHAPPLLPANCEGLPGDMCQCPHWGYMLQGELCMHTPSGSQTYNAGEAFYWAAGHAPEAITDCEYIDFSPSDELHAVLRHVTGG